MPARLIAAFLPLLFSYSLFSQKSIQLAENDKLYLDKLADTLDVLSTAWHQDSIKTIRLAACKSFIPALVRALKTPGSFTYPFSNLKPVSILYPQDSSFRIFTWLLQVDSAVFHPYGVIQIKSQTGVFYPLFDKSKDIENPVSAILDTENWYGCLYYGIKTFGSKKKPLYVLFGFNERENEIREKVADILYFENGKPFFGQPVFNFQDSISSWQQSRLILQYHNQASVHLNWDNEQKLIVYDHLMPIMARDGSYRSIPDGTYEAFKLKKNKWVWIEKLKNTEMSEAPRPQPILDDKQKDLFGNDRKH